MASECFQDSAVTPEQLVQKAKSIGLDCIAITDHNTPLGIDSIKAAAAGQGITVFPGVEITCSRSLSADSIDTYRQHLIFSP